MKVQHKVPIGPNDKLYHEAQPIENPKHKGYCAICGKKIITVGDNEGPENLKALFRL